MDATSPNDGQKPSLRPVVFRQHCWELLLAVGGAAIVVLGIVGWALVSFGSVRDAWLYARGARVMIEPRRVKVADGKPGEMRTAAFRLRNLTDRPVTVLGAETTCTCLSLEDRPPLVVPPKGTRLLRLAFELRKAAEGQFEPSIVYYTDHPASPRLTARVTGKVVEP